MKYPSGLRAISVPYLEGQGNTEAEGEKRLRGQLQLYSRLQLDGEKLAPEAIIQIVNEGNSQGIAHRRAQQTGQPVAF